MNRSLTKSVVEGLIFAHSEPLSVEALEKLLPAVPRHLLEEILQELEEEYNTRSRGFTLRQVGGGYQFRTLPEVAPWILSLRSIRPTRLSRAALETLAVIAYNQPITKSRIEQIRGVESSSALKSLLERDLVAVSGKLEGPGRPLLYATTQRFLEVFGLKALSELPPLPDIEVIVDD
ncbi:MAG: SMC-Scp complex subunit ScpB [Desulfomonilaceae bacterium]